MRLQEEIRTSRLAHLVLPKNKILDMSKVTKKYFLQNKCALHDEIGLPLCTITCFNPFLNDKF